jgi:HD-like signal output (HDOD) protein
VVGRAQASLWRDLSDPDVDLRRLHQALREDPAIAVRVLKVANSAYYRRGGQIATIEQAILMLGLDAVRGIAASAGLDRIAGRGEQAAAFVAHSVAVACIARDSAAIAGLAIGGEAFLAGLLHDIGLLVEWRLAALLKANGPRELAVDPWLHVRCAQVVLAAWQLPATVVDAVAAHHAQPQESEPVDPLGACVRVAHCACVEAGMLLPGDGPTDAEQAPHPLDLLRLGIAPEAWSAQLPQALARAARMYEGMLA